MLSIDLFCRVVDNYGDIGVCWRLARQLVVEHSASVRLIVDDLAAFRFIAPEIDPALTQQHLLGVDVAAWSVSEALQPADIVIEAFGCNPPEPYVLAMSAVAESPAWINLEYLSAESWVDGVHGLPSPHPTLRLTKYFFCPGFTEASGGLIRERVLAEADWIGQDDGGLGRKGKRIDLFAFAYPHAPVRAFADALNVLSVLSADVTIAAKLDDTDPAWRAADPVPQTEFDALLAPFDVLIVRGEDSFLRAQYAAKPFLWHIYPTPDNAHFVKLDAWLNRYCDGLATDAANALRHAQHAFNRGDTDAARYADFAAHLPSFKTHAARWREHLFAQTDLATRLLKFVNSLKSIR